jgi:hypothetical protein
MKIMPAVVTTTESDAERKVFALLEHTELGPHARAFHSLNISEHEYKLVGELDFLVLAPQGLLILEVKGGGVSCHEGLWTFTDRFGRKHKTSEGPFRQARSGMFSLRKRLRSDLHPSVTAGLVFGYGVIFPDTDFPKNSAEWAPAMVIDTGDLRGQRDLGDPLRSLLAYWDEKTNGAQDVTPSRIDTISDFLRPDFEKIPSLRHRADQLLTAMESLTEEEYHQLDLVENSDRVLCAGGAGTGKTFLAAEVARRDAARGGRVLLTCRSPVLASFLADRLAGATVDVVPLEKALDDKTDPYDVLVLDEAQDVLDFESLDRVGDLVAGGLESGRWRIFYDVNNQSALFGKFDPDALEYLQSLAGAGGHLRRNCRNTRDIVIQTKLVTHADLGKPSAGHGPPVEWTFFSDLDSEQGLLKEHLRRLAAEDVPPGDVTILSPVPYAESCVARMRTKWRKRIRILDPETAAAWPLREMTFASVADFKGLENQFIALVDINSLSATPRDRSLLYIAMTRARAGLWVALSERLRADLTALQRDRLAVVMEDTELAKS